MYDIEIWKKQKKFLGLTYDDLAEKSGISISALKSIFMGITKDPRIETVTAIENALELTQENSYMTMLEEELLEAFREIGKKFGREEQKFFLDILKSKLNTKN